MTKESVNGQRPLTLYIHVCISVAWWPGGQGGQSPPSDNFLGALKSKRGAKIRNSNVKYYTKYVKSSLSTNSKILKHLMARVKTAFY